MRARPHLSATALVACAFIIFATGSHARESAASPMTPPGPKVRFAPIPATAWTGLAVLSGIIVVRAIRRRGH